MEDTKKKRIKSLMFVIVIAFASFILGFSATVIFALTNIDATYPNYYAWSDIIGWINFLDTNTVYVQHNKLRGYATYGPPGGPYNYISLDCATGPADSNCAVNYNVTNDGYGNLSGWAWSDEIGWISFDCHNPETGGSAPNYSCIQSNYQTKIDSNGYFHGWAWNDAIGWISFNCNQTETGDLCGTSNYKVKTNWQSGPIKANLISGTFDTGKPKGAAFNYIVWEGTLNGGSVKFQFATSNCDNGATNSPHCDQNVGWGGNKASGDGAFLGPGGSSAETDAYSPMGPNSPIELLNQATHNNKRYYRYKMYLETSNDQSATPVVEDVIVNWSP